MKNILTIILLVSSLNLLANENESSKKGHLIGTIIDGSTGHSVEYATVAIYNSDTKKLAGGGISDSEGFFRIKDNAPGTYYLTITFMGYKTKNIPNIIITDETKVLDLDNITIVPNSKELADINVVADQASVQYRIDKKIVNVGQQLTAKSGSAVDILENIPSVKVDIDGNVSLRGSSSFTVLIDGIPTVLDPSDALSQIPAGAIENIEIITNPSAKYEPDGTSGIINIVTKKNKLNGISGIVNANVGRDGRYGSDATVDYRNNKWHLYMGADYNVRRRLGEMDYTRKTFVDSDTTTIKAIGDFTRQHIGGGVRAGFDYNITEKDIVGASIRVGYYGRERGSELDYNEYFNSILDSIYNTTQSTMHDGAFISANFNYKHTFNDSKEHFLEIKGNIRSRDGDEKSTTESYSEGVIFGGSKTTESGPSLRYRAKIDYAKPLSWGDKFETGFHFNFSRSEDNNQDFTYDPGTGNYNPVITDYPQTIYTRNTYALYGIYGGERGNLGYQAGLRMEYTYRFLELADNTNSYTIERPDYFPTLHLSYKLPADQELMTSYTRRIERPRGWFLEPFITKMDEKNVRSGNPGILPEYVNSFDLGYQKKFGKNFVSLEAYYRITDNKIERVMSIYDQDPTGEVNLHTFENIGTDYALGVELGFNYSPVKWYTTNLMADFYDYRLKGVLNDSIIDQHDFSWSSRFNNTFKLSPNTRLQIDLNYHSDRVEAQGTHDGFFMVNTAIKQDFFKRKLSATFQVRDVFQTMGHGSTTFGDGFEQKTKFQPNTPMYMLTLSYKINNYRNKRNGGNNGGEEGGEEGGF